MELHRYQENPFKKAKRYLPLELPYPFTDSYVFNLSLPENYTIESLPESSALKLEGGIGRFSYLSSVQDNKIHIVVRTIIRKDFIAPNQYSNFRTFFQQLEEKLNEPIVIKRS
jgi:hypothetical protein